MEMFCEKCLDHEAYTIKTKKKTKKIRGEDIIYTEKIAFCNTCGDEIFISKLRDENLKSLDEEFRKKKGLITASKIKEILNKYNIGKRPLSIILGWGEGTLTRFIDGDIPSFQYSEILKKINNNPKFLLELLEKNKNKITNKAYEKSLTAINTINSEKCIINSKIESVANYIIKESIEITPLALQKLLYYTQSFYCLFHSKFLFKDNCEAWVHGPVYREIYFKYKDHGYNPIDENLEQFNCFDLEENEIKIIDEVINNLGCYSGKILEKMTHFEEPWKEARKGLTEDELSTQKISKEKIKSYFDLIRKKYDINEYSDIKKYSSQLFSKLSHDS